jgi:hypothetical protein
MTEGYIYCFSNVSMPNILKVGMTERDPEIRLNEANGCDTWRPPTPYKLVIAKKVINPKHKEYTLHKILTKYAERVNPKREFFRISIEDIKPLFDLIDGDLWVENVNNDNDKNNNSDESLVALDGSSRGCRDMLKCFIDGQRIRHISLVGNKTTWIGIYNSSNNSIIYDDKIYESMSKFANTHYYDDGFRFNRSANGWKECEYEVNDKWISTYNIQC